MPVEDDSNGTYILSSKDLCLIRRIPDIVDMGVTSLKIEGRLKSEYYVASVVNAYRNAIDDYINNPQGYDYNKYLTELEKVKTRGLTEFFFNDKSNKDFQEYEGKQYNPEYEYGAQVLEYNENKSILKIGNKLNVGDKMEILIPDRITPEEFTINKMWDTETDEEIETVNPGKLGQSVKMHLPIKCETGWMIRRKNKRSGTSELNVHIIKCKFNRRCFYVSWRSNWRILSFMGSGTFAVGYIANNSLFPEALSSEEEKKYIQ